MFDAKKMGLLSDEEMLEACEYENSVDYAYDMTSTKGQKAAQAALAAGPAAAVFLPVAAAAAV